MNESKLKKYFYLKNFCVKHFSNSFIHKICGKRMRIQKRWKNFLFFSQSVGKARRVYLEQKFLCVLINQKLLKSYGLLKTENLLYCRENFLCIKSQSMLGIFYYAKQRVFSYRFNAWYKIVLQQLFGDHCVWEQKMWKKFSLIFEWTHIGCLYHWVFCRIKRKRTIALSKIIQDRLSITKYFYLFGSTSSDIIVSF